MAFLETLSSLDDRTNLVGVLRGGVEEFRVMPSKVPDHYFVARVVPDGPTGTNKYPGAFVEGFTRPMRRDGVARLIERWPQAAMAEWSTDPLVGAYDANPFLPKVNQ